EEQNPHPALEVAPEVRAERREADGHSDQAHHLAKDGPCRGTDDPSRPGCGQIAKWRRLGWARIRGAAGRDVTCHALLLSWCESREGNDPAPRIPSRLWIPGSRPWFATAPRGCVPDPRPVSGPGSSRGRWIDGQSRLRGPSDPGDP